MLAIYKYINKDISNPKKIYINTPDKKNHHVANKLSTEQEGGIDGKVSTTTITFQWKATITGNYTRISNIEESTNSNRKGGSYISNDSYSYTELSEEFVVNKDDDEPYKQAFEAKEKFEDDIYEKYKKLSEQEKSTLLSGEKFGTVDVVNEVDYGVLGEFDEKETVKQTARFDSLNTDIKFKRVKRKYDTDTIDNPISGFFDPSDAFKLLDKEKNHYLRFGALLEYIRDKILIKIDAGKSEDENPPIFDIDTDEWRTHMYSLPNQISLNPRVCIVKNLKFESKGGTVAVFKYLSIFKEVDNGKSTNDNAAYPLNIYLNFEFIKECLKADEKGNVSVYELISNICTGLNKALGGINNLEPIIDEEKNILRIIDTTPIPGYTAQGVGSYKIQIYGYNKTGNDYISNFVRKVDLKTAITPEYATMITVGATAGGYIKGTEATAFSKWNTGLIDRFKETFTPATSTIATEEENKDEPYLVYKEEFIDHGYTTRYGFTSFNAGSFKLSDNLIEKNISVVTEYYKWLIAKNAESSTVSGGTVGFIPFKLGLTLDGISGIKIYNVLRVNTEFLPKAYGKTVDLIVTGVSHRLNNNDWETSVEATVMPKTGAASTVAITAEEAKETLNEAVNEAVNSPTIKGKVSESKKNVVTKIVELAKKNGITDRERLTCILAVAGGETQWNPGKSESFAYSLSRAREVFGSRIPKNDAAALKYIPKEKGGSGSQEKLANFLYGGRYGKDNEGWKYRGRGMTQITFKGNYTNVQNKLVSKFFPNKGNIVTNPDLVNDTDVSVAILVYGKIQGFFGDKLVANDKAYLSNAVRVQATQNGSNGKGKRRSNATTKNYANAIYAINNTPWVQNLIS
jgi:predicted chitinase